MPVNNKELLLIAEEIRGIIADKQREMSLSFVEETHTYFIKNKDGKIVSNLPSVSTVITQYYTPFDDLTKSLEMCNGNLVEQDSLLKEWREAANYANSTGSRVHFLLETDLLKIYKSDKKVRKPIFECNEEQIFIGNQMIDAGHKFIQLMHRRGAVLLDTEMVLGSIELGYTGQPDKVWLIMDKDGQLGFIITDWKTNKPKNFEIQDWTTQMLPPFEAFVDTALSHYKIQLPLYGRLILDMLKGTKYANIKFLGCIIVHLLRDGRYVEYRVENAFINTVLNSPPLPRINEVFSYKKNHALREENRIKKLKEIING